MSKKNVFVLVLVVAAAFFFLGRMQVGKAIDTGARKTVDNFFAEIEKVCDVDYENVKTSVADKSTTVTGVTVKTLLGNIAIDKVTFSNYKEGITVKDYFGNDKEVPESIDVSVEGIIFNIGGMLNKLLEMPQIAQGMGPEQIAALTNALDALGISEELVIDYDQSSKFDFDKNTMDVNLTITLRGLVSIEEQVSLAEFDLEKLSTIKQGVAYNPADPASMEALEPVMDIIIGNCSVTLIDNSLVERVIKLSADNSNTSPEDVKAQMKQAFSAADADEAPQFAKDLAKAMLNVLDGKSDRLTVNLKPEEGMSIMRLVELGESKDEEAVLNSLGISVVLEQD
jgi:hypothetical protein